MRVSRSRIEEVMRDASRAGMSLALGIGLLAGLVSGSGATPVQSHLFAGANPRTDGTNVIYEVMGSTGDLDVDAASVADHLQFPIAIGEGQAMNPDIAGDVAVWQETNANGDYDIAGKHIDSGQRFTLAAGDRQQVYPALSGDWVAYVSAPREYTPAGEQFLQATNLELTEGEKLDSVPVGGGSGGFLRPAISGKRVAWVRMEQIGDHVVHWQLKTQLLGDDSATIVAEKDLDIGGPLGALSTPVVDVSGDVLVYAADLRLTVVNLATGERTELASPSSADFKAAENPTTDGRYVFWQDERRYGTVNNIVSSLQSGTLNVDIYGYDLLNGSEFLAVPGTAYNVNPYTRGGLLTYERRDTSGSGSPQIYALPVAQVLPTAPQPDPGDPNVTYFSETGHSFGGAFRDFWKISGGLPVFGYPLTDVFTEHGLAVQYVERQRFEAHPEFDGTPYAVELGLLGSEDAAQRGLLASGPFQPLPAGTRSDANCEFFPATGHRLCFGFKSYWHAHGLEFGDAGVSERESLALFGYPVSEEFVDPATGLTTQYFERARFEYHPDNPEPYTILLGRLAADRLTQRGW
jgi:hypothetical protein